MSRIVVACVGLISLGSFGVAIAQDQDESRQPRRRGGRQDEGGGPRGGPGADWRERMERWQNATPQQRREMELDGWLRMIDRTYELSDTQRQTIRAELQKMRDEYRASLGPDAAEMDRLREEMGNYWRQRMQQRDATSDAPDPRDDPRFQELRDRMRDLMQRHPINWDAGRERIETFLTPEQIAAGRERRERMMQQWAGRRGPGQADDNAGERRGRRRDAAGERRRRDADATDDSRRFERRARPAAPENEAPRPAAPPPAPPHPWDLYVEGFIRDKKLTPDQVSAARAVLADLKKREVATRESQAAQRAEAQRATDAALRTKRLAELDAPINAMFEELKARLSALLTAEQRSAA